MAVPHGARPEPGVPRGRPRECEGGGRGLGAVPTQALASAAGPCEGLLGPDAGVALSWTQVAGPLSSSPPAPRRLQWLGQVHVEPMMPPGWVARGRDLWDKLVGLPWAGLRCGCTCSQHCGSRGTRTPGRALSHQPRLLSGSPRGPASGCPGQQRLRGFLLELQTREHVVPHAFLPAPHGATSRSRQEPGSSATGPQAGRRSPSAGISDPLKTEVGLHSRASSHVSLEACVGQGAGALEMVTISRAEPETGNRKKERKA